MSAKPSQSRLRPSTEPTVLMAAARPLRKHTLDGVRNRSMPGPQVDELVRQILQGLPQVRNLDAAVQDLRKGLDILIPGLSENLSTEISEARQLVEQQFASIEILHKHSVLRSRPRWPSDRGTVAQRRGCAHRLCCCRQGDRCSALWKGQGPCTDINGVARG